MKRLIAVIENIFVKQYGYKVIFATHSSATVAFAPKNSTYLMDKDNTNEILTPLENQSVLNILSFNEVNYVIFGIPTEQYHIELYGLIEASGKLNEFKLGKKTNLYKKWNQKKTNILEYQIILSEYIRHQIHHSDNQLNSPYTEAELKKSIDLMREFIFTCLAS